jgi:plasmid stabilization system protein ParE
MSVVCGFFICLGLVVIGLYQGRGALLYILAGMLIGVIVGMLLSHLWHHLLESHPQLGEKLRYQLLRAEESKNCESEAGEAQKRPLNPAEDEERATKQREFDEIISHIHELRKDPQAYDNYEREIKNTTKLRADYGGTMQVRKERIRTQASLIEDIWQNCFKLNPYFSFIHDRSRIAAWESLAGGKSALIAAIEKRYGANIADIYDEALPIVLNKIANARKTLR